MPVTKRTRFEVLRRAEFRCQYCGLKSTETAEGLTIDHVIPVALGGSDKPDNLVAACRDCNAGKSSIQPDSPIVNQLSAEASAYALGMLDKMTKLRGEVQQADTDFIQRFRIAWDSWKVTSTGETIPLPPDWELSLFRWYTMGVPYRVIEMAIPKAMAKPFIKGEFGEFNYMAGIVWSMINSREIDYSVTEDTVRTYTKHEVEDNGHEQYVAGLDDGRSLWAMRIENQDLVRLVVDGQHDHWAYKRMAEVG